MLRDIAAYSPPVTAALTLDDVVRGIKSPTWSGRFERMRTNPPMKPSTTTPSTSTGLNSSNCTPTTSPRTKSKPCLPHHSPGPHRPIGQDEVELEREEDRDRRSPSAMRTRFERGMPGRTLPAGRGKSGLPIGMELDGPMGSDSRLLAIGMAMKALFGPLEAPASNVFNSLSSVATRAFELFPSPAASGSARAVIQHRKGCLPLVHDAPRDPHDGRIVRHDLTTTEPAPIFTRSPMKMPAQHLSRRSRSPPDSDVGCRFRAR